MYLYPMGMIDSCRRDRREQRAGSRPAGHLRDSMAGGQPGERRAGPRGRGALSPPARALAGDMGVLLRHEPAMGGGSSDRHRVVSPPVAVGLAAAHGRPRRAAHLSARPTTSPRSCRRAAPSGSPTADIPVVDDASPDRTAARSPGQPAARAGQASTSCSRLGQARPGLRLSRRLHPGAAPPYAQIARANRGVPRGNGELQAQARCGRSDARGQSGWTKVHWAGDTRPTKVKVSAERRWARGRADVGRQMSSLRQWWEVMRHGHLIDHSCGVVRTRWWRLGILSLAQVAAHWPLPADLPPARFARRGPV